MVSLAASPRLNASSSNEHAQRILVVDDHPITRQGLKALIEPQGRYAVCGEADSAETAVEQARKLQPHLIVLDISLRASSGTALIEALKGVAKDARILVISMHEESLYAERALKSGAHGYLMKSEASGKLTDAIRKVLSGEIFLSEVMTRRLANGFIKKRSGEVVSQMDSLSSREKDVFRLIGDGLSTRQIATQLGLSVKTIDSYREHLKTKLGIPTGPELVQYAIRWSNAEAATASKEGCAIAD